MSPPEEKGHRVLDAPLTCHRLGDVSGNYPVFSGVGSAQAGGRWNRVGQSVIYCSERYSTALLERLAYAVIMPPRQFKVEVTLPAGCSYEQLDPASLPGWHDASSGVARRFGARWVEEGRSLALIVPCALAWSDCNVVLNPAHPDFARVEVGREVMVHWDTRLFGKLP